VSGRVEVGTVGGGVVDTDLQYTAQGGTAMAILRPQYHQDWAA